MNASTYRFTLDLHKSQSQASVSVFKNDSAVRLCMSLSDGANRYRIEDGCTAILYGNKPNGKPFVHSCVIEDNYQIVYEFTKTTASVVGIVNAQLRLYKGAEPERDEKGNIVYVGGDPIYETDADGNPKKDDNGNPIHQKDANGRLMYTDISIKFKNDHKLITAPKFIIVVNESFAQDANGDLDDESLTKNDYTAWEDVLLAEKLRQDAHKLREERIQNLEKTYATKRTKIEEANKIYGTAEAGVGDVKQVAYDVSTSETPGVAMRGEDGHIELPIDPSESQAVRRDYVDKADLKKVDKLKSANVVYTTDSNSEQSSIPYSSDSNPNVIVRRTEDGHIKLPVDNLSEADEAYAMPKKYVDDEDTKIYLKLEDHKKTLETHGETLEDHNTRLGEVEKFFEVDGETLDAARDTLIEIQKELDSDDKGAEAMAASIEKNRSDIAKKVESFNGRNDIDLGGSAGGVYVCKEIGGVLQDEVIGYSRKAIDGDFVMRAGNGNIILPSDMSLINNAFYAVSKEYVDSRYEGLKNSKLDNAGLEKKVLLENEGKQLFALLNKSADIGVEMVPGIPYTVWSPASFDFCYEDKAENGVTDVATSLSPDGFVRNFKDINGDTWQLKLTESGFDLSKIRADEDGSIGIENFSELEFPEWSEGKKTIATEQYVDELVGQNLTGSSEVIPDTVVKRDNNADVLVPLLPKSAASAASRHYTDGIYDSLEKRIENLEHDTLIYFEDSTAAYEKVVPEGYKPNAILTSIGGASVKCNNKIPFPYKESDKTTGGITYTIQNDGGIRRVGTATSTTWITLSTDIEFEDGKTYYKSPKDLQIRYERADGSAGYAGTSFTWSKEYTLSQVYIQTNSGDVKNEIAYPMLNEGETKKPYEPFYSGFKHAEVEKIESRGVNLLPFPYEEEGKTVGGITYTIQNDGGIRRVGTATSTTWITLSTDIEFEDGKTYYKSPKDLQIRYERADGSAGYAGTSFTWSKEYTLSQVYIQTNSGDVKNEIAYPMISTTKTDYIPYIEPQVIEIPEAVKARDGYGMGKNYIRWNDGKVEYVQVAKSKTMTGSLLWGVYPYQSSTGAYVYYTGTNDKKVGNNTSICSAFENISSAWIDGASGQYSDHETNTMLYFCSDIATLDEWKAWLKTREDNKNPVVIEYELAEPIVTDITHLFPKGFNIFKTVPNGAWRFVNEHKLDVPNTVLYVNRKE